MRFRTALLTALITLLAVSCQHEDILVPEVPASLSVSASVIDRDEQAFTETVDVIADCGWDIFFPTPSDWVNVRPSEGKIVISSGTNDTGKERTACLYVVPDDTRVQAVRIDILQDAPVDAPDFNTLVVAMAEKRLTMNARLHIDPLIIGKLRNEALWLDAHSREYAYMPPFHTVAMNSDYVYAPDWTQQTGGDCLRGLHLADYYLSHQDYHLLPDADRVFYLRILIHLMGDLHNPDHACRMPEGKFAEGTDAILKDLCSGMSYSRMIRTLDTCTEGEVRACGSGSLNDWAKDCCRRAAVVDENSVAEAVRTAAYRLANMINSYYGTY